MMTGTAAARWLPEGKTAAVCFTVDDVHPATSAEVWRNGDVGDIARAALAELRTLQTHHPQLKATLFSTPDWRSAAPFPTRPVAQRLPFIRNFVYTVPVLKKGTYRLDRHPRFAAELREWPGIEIALHGLDHVSKGTRPITEFARLGTTACRRRLASARLIFAEAGLPIVQGMCPPGWDAPPPLLRAMSDLRMSFVASARDLDTPIAEDAVTGGSGLKGMSLIRPQWIDGYRLLHFPTNFQATSSRERAHAIIRSGGLLSIKAHLLASSGSYRALDGLTEEYRRFLDALFTELSEQYGDAIWWTTMGEIASLMTSDQP